MSDTEYDATKEPRAYAQWVSIVINNVGSKDIKMKNLAVSWGKLYADGNKDKEVPASNYEGKTIKPYEKMQLNACGRENSPSGTTGDFNLVDPSDGDRIIRHFYWDCPWGSKQNTWTVSESNSKFMVEHSGANLNSGALGTITVDVLNKPGY